jgi:hypothetical protein
VTELNKEQIKFIDSLFIDLNNGITNHECFRKSKFDLNDFDYLNNYSLTIAEELNLVVLSEKFINKHIVTFHKIACEKFIANGGFKTYFRNKKRNNYLVEFKKWGPIFISVIAVITPFVMREIDKETQDSIVRRIEKIEAKTTTIDSLNNQIYQNQTRINLLKDSLDNSYLDTLRTKH